MSTNPEMSTQTISTFTQKIFRKYGLSEIALTDIDEKKLGNSVIDLENTTKAELASTIVTYIFNYIDQNLYDEELFWEFKPDFSGWKRIHLDTAGILKKDLKRTLLERGIFVPSKGYPDSIALEMVISEEKPHVWTTEEIAAALKKRINYHPKISIFENTHTPHTSMKIEKNNDQNLKQTPVRSNIKQIPEPPNNPLLIQGSSTTPFQPIGHQSSQYDNQNMTLPPVPV
ncbi:hypothetical protein Golomagni_03945 [Golovinomyces magnicellulatus]|nr:hypothetical protein Golomagni_03945 [Golovinomyces magnicellulatus]